MSEIIGVIGSGSMGAGIAQIAASNGHKVLLYDKNAEALDRAKKGINKILARLVEKERLTNEVAREIDELIHPVGDLSAFESCDLVIEAIVENLMIKKEVFGHLEKIVSKNCVLASNTSSLSIASIASACQVPERVLGIHFFNPAPLMPLVEIIPGVLTSATIVQEVRQTVDGWGKITVLAKDTPGFIVNRLARPFYGEAIRIYEEGIADFATIDWAMKELGGFKMGPFELMDYIGNDVNYTVTETVFESFFFDPRYKPSFTQKRMAEAGLLGRKTGRGYYDYSEGVVPPKPDENIEKGKQIVDRILLMLINEAVDALYLKVASKTDLDLAMTKGVNYPKGLLKWAEEMGIERCYNGLNALYQDYCEDRYRPSILFKKLIEKGETSF